jgi:hypothetical protein
MLPTLSPSVVINAFFPPFSLFKLWLLQLCAVGQRLVLTPGSLEVTYHSLFVYALISDTVSSSEYIPFSGRMISD